jgi:hypothetical protein
MRVKPGLRALWRGPREAQIGAEPNTRLIIELEDPREHGVLDALDRNLSLKQLRGLLIRAGHNGDRADALVAQVEEAGLMEAAKVPSARSCIPPELREFFAAQAETRALWQGGDGWEDQLKLKQASVHIAGLGRTGARVALTLAQAGVGRLRLTDPRPVRLRDCGGDYPVALVGERRDTALAKVVAASETDCIAQLRPRGPADATVMVDMQAWDIARARDLVYRSLPHYAVLVGELGTTCGPWVIPGQTACLRCLSLHRCEEDKCWPAVATQLSVRSPVAARGEDPALAAAAGAFAAGQVVAGLLELDEPSLGGATTFTMPSLATRFDACQPHPECGCLGLPDLAPEDLASLVEEVDSAEALRVRPADLAG